MHANVRGPSVAALLLALLLAWPGTLQAGEPMCTWSYPCNTFASTTYVGLEQDDTSTTAGPDGTLPGVYLGWCFPKTVLASTNVRTCATFAEPGYYRGTAVKQLMPEDAPKPSVGWTYVHSLPRPHPAHTLLLPSPPHHHTPPASD